tara:strand:- start:54 stop:617 length:564 start_codon:yes stop_codon:yes gene_type:complete
MRCLSAVAIAAVMFSMPVADISAQTDACTSSSIVKKSSWGYCGLEVEDPEVLRYQLMVLSASDYLDESLVVEILEGSLRTADIIPVRVEDTPLTPRSQSPWTGPMLGIWVLPIGFEGWAFNVQFIRPVSYQIGRGRTRRGRAATWWNHWPRLVSSFSEEEALSQLRSEILNFTLAFRRANGLDGNSP